MKKLLIIILMLLFMYCNLFALSIEEKNNISGSKFIFVNITHHFKSFIFNLLNRDFYPKQEIDFMSRSSKFYELLREIKISINKPNSKNTYKVDQDWIKYLKKLKIIDGAVINYKNEKYLIGDIPIGIEKNQGFHIENGLFYYYFLDKERDFRGKFLINWQYIIDSIFYDFKEKNFNNNLIIKSLLIELPKNSEEKIALYKLFFLDNINNRKTQDNIIYKFLNKINIKKINFILKRRNDNYQKWFNRRMLLGINKITYIEKLYSDKESNLIFTISYKNRITANYIYALGLLISLLVTIFLLVMLIIGIHLEKKGGILSMDNIDEKEENNNRDKLPEKRPVNNLGNPIEEIDDEVSKIIMEEHTEDDTKEKVVESEENLKVKNKKEEDKKFEELKKDGIIIK